MNILVVGSTGETGLELVKQAKERGHSVTAFARSPEKLGSFEDVSIARGDVLDEQSLVEAVKDQDAVLSVLGAPLGQEVGTVRSEGTRNLVQAMQSEEVKRLVAVSAIGVADSRDDMSFFAKLLLPRIVGKERLDEAQRQEEVVRASSLDWTLVRPPRLLNGESKGVRAATGLKTKFTDTLQRVDLAGFMLDQLEIEKYSRSVVTVAG